MTFRVLGPARAGPVRPGSLGASAGADRLGRAERGRARAHHRAGTPADRRPHRARRPPLPHGRRGVRRAGRRRPITRRYTETMATQKACAGSETRGRRRAKTPRAGEDGGQGKATTKATRAAARKAAPSSTSEASGAPAGTSTLVIVESPAKAKTIGKYLGRGYRVRRRSVTSWICPRRSSASTSRTGFTPELVPIPGKEKTIAELKSAAKDSKEVLIATDPDREGEAIARHVATQIKPKRGASRMPIRRVLFHEITKDAVQRAIAERRRDRREEGRGAAGASRARSARRLQGEPGALEDREEGTLRRTRADRRAAADRRARAGDSRVQAGRVLDHRGAAREGRAAVHRASCTTSTARRRRSRTRPKRERDPRAISKRPQDVRRHRGQAARAPQESVGAVHDVARCSRKRRRSCRSAPSARCASRRISTRASRSATRARSVSSRTCVPTRRAWPRARRSRRATTCARCSARSIVAKAPQLYGDGKNAKNAQDAHEGDSSDRSDAPSGAR